MIGSESGAVPVQVVRHEFDVTCRRVQPVGVFLERVAQINGHVAIFGQLELALEFQRGAEKRGQRHSLAKQARDGSGIGMPPDDGIQHRAKAHGTAAHIQRIDLNTGKCETLYTQCDGHYLKGPNDIVFDAEGNFYFTDHGKTRPRDRDRTGVFYASPDGKMIKEVIFPMEGPNGIGLSPDGKTLYVAETPTGRLYAFDLVGPGEVGMRRVVATVPGAPPFNFAMCDSLVVDAEGNVIVATLVNGGLTSISPSGETTHYPCPDVLTTNACFAGPGLGTLYATLSTTGKLIAFDNWPTKGLKLNC